MVCPFNISKYYTENNTILSLCLYWRMGVGVGWRRKFSFPHVPIPIQCTNVQSTRPELVNGVRGRLVAGELVAFFKTLQLIIVVDRGVGGCRMGEDE